MSALARESRRFSWAVFISAAMVTMPGMLFAAPEVQQRPNILFIMSDDHAANAISCYGGRLSEVAKTPNIDRLAEEGMRLDNVFCTNSICTPSRACILTGQYSHLNGVYTLADTFDPGRSNVAKLLGAAGYQTAVIGKWHLKSQPSGFDYWNVLPGQGRYHDPVLEEIGTGSKSYRGHATDVITDLTLEWLTRRDKERPFFLLCHHKAPHGLWECAARHAHLYEDVEIPEPASLWEDKSHRSAGSREHGSTISPRSARSMVSRTASPQWPTGRLDITGMDQRQQTRAAYQKYLKDYLRCVAGIDESVGRLLDYLDRQGLAGSTIVIYTSDQGQLLGEHDYYDKRWMYEESLRMPLLVRYAGQIRPGSVNRDVITNADFAPTFLDYAGLPTPPKMQGRSFRANLAGNTPADWPRSMYYRYWMHMAHHANPAHYGVRTGRFKLIFFYGLPLDAKGAVDQPTEPGWELYDLENDPNELNNVYNDPAYAGTVKKLKTELLRLKEKLGDTDEKYPQLMKLRQEHWE